MRFIFVGGYMHSGTTMLQKVLTNHSLIFGIPFETRLFEYWNRKKKVINLQGIADKLNENVGLRVDCEECLGRDSLVEYWNCMFKDVDFPYVAEKTPTNIYYTKEILEKFGETAKIALIHRSPFQVLASKKERLTEKSFSRYESLEVKAMKKLEKDYDVFLDCLSWRKAFNTAIKHQDDKNIHVINYSEFVQAPSNECKKLFKFLGLNFQAEVLDLKSANSASIEDTKVKGVSTIRLDKYKSILTRRELAQISFLCKNELKILGEDRVEWSLLDIGLLYTKSAFGLAQRVLKRFKMYSFADFLLHGRNNLIRILS